MSSQDYSTVAFGATPGVPASPGSNLLGPFVLYTLGQGQIATVEAVTFTATLGAVLGDPVYFVMQLRDPSANILWQYLAPPFGDAI